MQLLSFLVPSCSSLWQPPTCFLSLWIYLFGIFHINGMILCLASYTQHDVFQVHPHCSMWIISLLEMKKPRLWEAKCFAQRQTLHNLTIGDAKFAHLVKMVSHRSLPGKDTFSFWNYSLICGVLLQNHILLPNILLHNGFSIQ